MKHYKTLRQSLLGELAMSPERKRERERERENNAIYSGHLRLCQQPMAAHALRSDQCLLLFYRTRRTGGRLIVTVLPLVKDCNLFLGDKNLGRNIVCYYFLYLMADIINLH